MDNYVCVSEGNNFRRHFKMKNFDRRDRIFTRTEGSDNYVKYFIRYTSRKIISQC